MTVIHFILSYIFRLVTTLYHTEENDGTNENEVLTPPLKRPRYYLINYSFIDLEYTKYGMKNFEYKTDSKTANVSLTESKRRTKEFFS